MEKKTTLFGAGVNAGLIIAGIGIILFILEYVSGFMPIGVWQPLVIGLVSIVVTIVVLVLLVRNYRSKNGGVLPFKDAFLFALIAFIVSAFISSLFSYVFMNFFDPQYITKISEGQRSFMENYLSGKVSEEKLSTTLDQIDEKMKNIGSIGQTIKGFFTNVILGAVIALIVGAIMKKETNMFEDKTTGGVI